jgi:hypothetical protein
LLLPTFERFQCNAICLWFRLSIFNCNRKRYTHLATSQLNFANTKLAENGIVLGSSQDGGFLSLGIKKNTLRPKHF